MKKRTILVVEDDGYIADVLKSLLEANDYRVLSATSGKGALQLAASHVPDVVLLDLGLPDIDGTHVLTSLREWYEGPVIIVSARNQEKEKVQALDMGADDYIVKPFSPGEVMARIRAVLRRIPAAAEKEMLVIGELSIHLPSLSATLSGHKLNLTRREVELLYTLAASPGRVFTRDNLLTIVWGYEFAGNYRAVDSHIKRLRAKLDAYPHDTFTIATVWGAGYKFERNLP